jgi:hypothetical protein
MSVNLFNKPYWIVGFTDAEGCFRINTYSNKVSFRARTLRVRSFHISQKDSNSQILHDIKSFFNCGQVVVDS